MNIKFFCPLWGSNYLPFETFCDKAKHDGYDGVELGLPADKTKKDEIIKTLESFELSMIGQHYETTDSDFNQHKKIYLHRRALPSLSGVSTKSIGHFIYTYII